MRNNRRRGWALATIVGLAASVHASGQPEPVPEAAPAAPAAPILAEPPKETPASEVAQPETPSGDVDAEAKAAFDRFVDAMKSAKAVSFDVQFAIEGNMKEMFGTASAKVIARRGESGWAYRMTGKGKRTAKADDVEFDIVYADGNASWLDKDAKKLYVRPVATARGKQLEAASNLRTLGDLFTASPLAKERVSPSMSLREPEKVGSVECVVAAVTGAPGTMSGDSIFAFGKDDHFPRKITRERSSSKGTTAMVLELSSVKLDGTYTEADFTIALPEGFTKDEQLANKPSPSRAPDKAAPVAQPKPVTDPGSDLPAAPGVEFNAPTAAPIIGPDGVVTLPGTVPGEIAPVQPPLSQPGTVAPSVTGNPAPTPPTANPAPAVDSGPMQPFELKTLDGKTVTLDSIKGRPTVVLFFGSWSLSSRKALPELKDLAERYKDQAHIYAAAVRQRDPQAAGRMVSDAGLTIPVIADADTLAEQWSVGAYPALYVLGADGEFLRKPDTSKLADMFSAARAALDAALGMTPAPAADAAQQPDLPLPGEVQPGTAPEQSGSDTAK